MITRTVGGLALCAALLGLVGGTTVAAAPPDQDKPTADDGAKDAVRAWLRLSQEYQQDGFYKFQLMDDSTKVAKDGDARVASGKTVVMQGGNGEINASLKFDEDGKLVKVTEEVKIKPGPR